jgi:hypothetical protein
MYIILTVYAIQGLTSVINDDVKSIYKDVTFLNLDTKQGEEPFEFAPDGEAIYGDGVGFDLAIGLTKGVLPPRHGQWAA